MEISKSGKNKLIIFLNIPNDYKGGAQRRYISLFTHLQDCRHEDYYFLLNESFLDVCVNDGVISNTTNILTVKVRYGYKTARKVSGLHSSDNVYAKRSKSGLKNLGLVSSFIRQLIGWAVFSIDLVKIVRAHKIGVIYGIFTGGIWSWPVARLMGIKFIYGYNDSTASSVKKSLIRIFSSEYFPLKYANKVDFLSEGVRNKLSSTGLIIPENRVLITPNSFVSYTSFQSEYPKENSIIFSSRLVDCKNPHLLLDAVSILRAEGFNDFNVIFLGDGKLYNELIERKKQLGLDNVTFLGGVADTSKYLAKSKIFISLQTENNYPSQSLLEAMACENAIIATDVGETSKIINNKVGLTIPAAPGSLASAIKKLLSDPEFCSRLGKNARIAAMDSHNIECFTSYFLKITQLDIQA